MKRTTLRLVLGVTLCVSLALGLAGAELLVRRYGRRPAPPPRPGKPNEPTMHVPDPTLGWRPIPGRFVFPGYTDDAPPITMTFWPDGSRATREQHVERDRRIVFVGDSFTQGWAVSDSETYPWKLQSRIPDVEVLNFGTAGYNAVQSMLRLQEHLDSRPTPPALVVYGFNQDQERRTVAEDAWVRGLANAAHRGLVRLPYALLDGRGGITLYPPEGYPTWPLRHELALVPLLEESWFTFRTRGRGDQKRAVTEMVIDRMNEIVRSRGSRLVVVNLMTAPEVNAEYAAWLQGHGIELVDCRIPFWLGRIVPGEGHPNDLAHSDYAGCIAKALDADLAGERRDTAR